MVNIYNASNQLLEERKFFRSWEKAKNFVEFVCPKIYGAGKYFFVILK